MDKQIIAIGGGGFGRNPGNGTIEKYILDQSDKNRPNICFIPTATGDDESYKVSYYATLTKLNCTPTHIDFFKRTIKLEKHISNQDIVFVGGGNTKSMLAVWREWDLDRILNNAYQNGVIMSGVSAGAICWFDKGITDSWKDHQAILPCLGFVDGICCPHYDEEPERIPFVKKVLEEGLINDCFAIDGFCALHMIDDIPKFVVSFGDNTDSYNVSCKDNKIIHNQINNTKNITL